VKSILALDVSSTATGWAFGYPDARPTSGVTRFADKGATEDEVWFGALRWMNTQLAVLNPDIVAMEAPFFSSAAGGQSNPKTMSMLLGLQAVLRTVVKARMPGRALLVASSSARKTFTGRGVYPAGEAKAAVQRECVARGWIDKADIQPDRCDALCLWGHVAAQQVPALIHGADASKVIPMRRAS
jgi:hypothetical protein